MTTYNTTKHLVIFLPSLFVEEEFPADQKGHYLEAWEEEFLSWKKLQYTTCNFGKMTVQLLKERRRGMHFNFFFQPTMLLC